MTTAALPDLTPRGLAMSEQFLDGSWRDEHGRLLFEAIANRLGSGAAIELWNAACDLVEQRQVTVQRRLVVIDGGAA